MALINSTENKLTFGIVVGFFATCFGLITFVNHYLFRTYALDLGLYTHTIYDYSHFRVNDSLLIQPMSAARNQLADHFDLFLILISPLIWIFGSYTLLIVQWIAILIGGLGIYFIFNKQGHYFALFATIQFFCIWGIYSALSFDYHSNVVGAMIIPWVFWALKNNNLRVLIVTTVLIIITKENMSLWLFFVFTGAASMSYFSASMRKISLVLATFCIFYFLFVIKVIMPALMPDGQAYLHLSFAQVGNGISDIIINTIRNPIKVLKLIYQSPYEEAYTWPIKKELHTFVFLSGGALILLRPAYFWMLIPIYAQKLLNDDVAKWGINSQYSIEYVPILCIGAFHVLSKIKFPVEKYILAIALIVITARQTYKSFEFRHSVWFDNTYVHIFDKKHYTTSRLDVARTHRILKSIPEQYSVGTSADLVPHLAMRKTIYTYLYWDNMDVIIVPHILETYYPHQKHDYLNTVQNLRLNEQYKILYKNDDIIVFCKQEISFTIND
jgi:uncharacterized membrane protein